MKKIIVLATLISITSSSFANINIDTPSKTLTEKHLIQLQKEHNDNVNKEKLQISTALKAAIDPSVKQKAVAKSISPLCKKEFENKIYKIWKQPPNSSGEKAIVRVTLSNDGSVKSIVVNTNNSIIKNSLETAIRDAAPYPMPSDPDARREARSFTSSFTSK